MLITIEKGEVFEGNEEQLLDCFGLEIDQLIDWCNHYGWHFVITEEKNV